MTITQDQYRQAREQAAALAYQSSSNRGRLKAESTLRDRTPVPQPKPLDEGQFIWGEPSEFAWGTSNNLRETGPYSRGGGPLFPPDDPPPDDPDEPPPKYETWKETSRKTKTVRITGSNGAWVDDVRFTDVTFDVPPDADGRKKFVTLTFMSS